MGSGWKSMFYLPKVLCLLGLLLVFCLGVFRVSCSSDFCLSSELGFTSLGASDDTRFACLSKVEEYDFHIYCEAEFKGSISSFYFLSVFLDRNWSFLGVKGVVCKLVDASLASFFWTVIDICSIL
jgi:hypothetical protein